MRRLRALPPVLAFALYAASLCSAQQQSANPFESLHASLADAADRTLAAALADRPWMSAAEDPKSPSKAAPPRDPTMRLRAAEARVLDMRPILDPILREEGVPPELSALVLVESGGLADALSHKGARGLWQFMPDTARRYGLVVSSEHDERTDVIKSTRAAARYLRDLHQQFGDWQLAFAAYNAGELAVARALAHRDHSFASIRMAMPQETRNYVPAVMTAIAALGNDATTPMHEPPSGTTVLYAMPEATPAISASR